MTEQIRIDRVAALMEAWLPDPFPFAKIKIKVLDRGEADFLAVPNVYVRNMRTRDVEYISGLAESVSDAVDDLLIRYMQLIRDNCPPTGLTETDFEWSDPHDF